MVKNKGFSVYESMIVIGIMAILTPLLISQIVNYADRLKAQQYVDQTKSYAKSFARMITDNYGDYYKQLEDNPTSTLVIAYSALQSGGYAPSGMQSKNIFKQTPCVSVMYNQQSKQLQAIMFYGYDTSDKNLMTISRANAY